jgi:hypothetical protein
MDSQLIDLLQFGKLRDNAPRQLQSNWIIDEINTGEIPLPVQHIHVSYTSPKLGSVKGIQSTQQFIEDYYPKQNPKILPSKPVETTTGPKGETRLVAKKLGDGCATSDIIHKKPRGKIVGF